MSEDKEKKSAVLSKDELHELYKEASEDGLENGDTVKHKGDEYAVQDIVAAVAGMAVEGLSEVEFSCPCFVGSTCWPKCRDTE